MPDMQIRRVKPRDNIDVLNAMRNVASPDYQRRIPHATTANIQDTINNLMNYRPGRNEFVEALINQVGLIIARNASWSNPMAKFKRGLLEWGNTIEEIQIGLLKSYTYDHDRDYLERDIFGQERPNVQSNFHRVNREEFYKITVKDLDLKRAFLDPNGLQAFITQLMEAPTTSDQWDEFLEMASLFKEYKRKDGFFKVNVPDVGAITSDASAAKFALRRLREMSDTLTFISEDYNAAHMPVAAKRDDLELFVTPEFNAAIDVEALAGAFNSERAAIPYRTTVIPKKYWGNNASQAVLTTKDFFVVADQVFETTSAPNPVGLYQNFFLHRWEVISASRFVPAIEFTTEPSTVIEINDNPVTGMDKITIVDTEGTPVTEVERGNLYVVQGSAIADSEGSLNEGVVLEIEGADSVYTKITQVGVLTVGLDEKATTLDIVATSTEDNDYTERTTVDVVGDRAIFWPNSVDNAGDGQPDIENVTAPAITPTANVTTGTVLTVSNGAWNPTPTSYTRQWFRDDAPIAGATNATYTVLAGDLTHNITAKVTGVKTGYTNLEVEANTVQPK